MGEYSKLIWKLIYIPIEKKKGMTKKVARDRRLPLVSIISCVYHILKIIKIKDLLYGLLSIYLGVKMSKQ